ncbi:MAG: PTS glucitol/sorbitol transporter subunit IIC [Eubacteriales bacterium]|nr:PTS glucitol/sorbitol transporter subunit IIC [Eubacteriales bacterium]
MEFISNLASGFMGLFQAGGETFTSWVTGIIPTIVCLMVAVNSVIKIIGEEKVTVFAQKCTSFRLGRYVLLPVMAAFFLGNPMMYSFGRFVEEKYKPAYYDSAVSFCHPITGLFPHANAGELFVFLGIADGITKLGLSTSGLALRYFLVGVIVIFIRGVVTEIIYTKMSNKA